MKSLLNLFKKSSKEPKVEKILYVSNPVSIVIRHPIDNTTKTIHKGNKNFDKIKECLETEDYQTALELIDVPAYIEHMTEGNVTYKMGSLYWKDEKVTLGLADKIIGLIQAAKDKDGDAGDAPKLMRFLDKLYENPSNRVYEQCFHFLDNHGFKFDDDGDILAYKRVGTDLYDLWTGTMKYEIGSFVKMNRRDVSDDPSNACASGIHFCTLDYVNSYQSGSGAVILMKIDPRDVVSVPESEASKGRCCKVKVLKIFRDDGEKIACKLDKGDSEE